ncbi:hypothetical protein, partial [Marinococcus halophilus]
MNNEYKFQLQSGDYLNRWLYSGPYVTPFHSQATVFFEPVNLTEEYRQIEYPLRTQYLQQRNKNEYPEEDDFQNIYFPFENNRFDFSSFITTPHILETNAKTFIKVKKNQTLPFQLTTCGSIDIWVNKEHQVAFSPFTRNIPSTQNIHLSLQAGENEIVIKLEDMAERDVNYYFEFIYLGKEDIESYIPINEDPIAVEQAENFLDNLYFEKDIYKTDKLTLKAPAHLGERLEPHMHVQINKNKLINPIFTSERSFPEFYIELNEENNINLGDIAEYNLSGVNEFSFGLKISDDVYVYRTLTVSLLLEQPSPLNMEEDLETRKTEALSYFANLNQADINVGIARLMFYEYCDEQTEQALRSCFQEIEQKEDCADFRLAPLMAIYLKKRHLLAVPLQEEIKALALDFRYWIDEPGNDAMWYFSENHAFLFHVSQYFAGYAFTQDVFNVSKRLGEEQYVLGKSRLLHWFENFFEYGFAEWNSTTYLPIDLIGFYTLYEAAPDKEIQHLAKQALDKTFKIIAINIHGKTMVSTYGRVYEHDLKAMENSEVANISFMLWGEGYFNHSLRAPVWFCLSEYTPPAMQDIVHLNEKQAVLAEYTQGIKNIYSYVYKTKPYSLASTINLSPYEKGHQQHVMNISLGVENTTMWINHPGESAFSGKNRPSYWAGNGRCPFVRQHHNTLIMKYKLHEEDYNFVHVYLPIWDIDEMEITNNWLFV